MNIQNNNIYFQLVSVVCALLGSILAYIAVSIYNIYTLLFALICVITALLFQIPIQIRFKYNQKVDHRVSDTALLGPQAQPNFSVQPLPEIMASMLGPQAQPNFSVQPPTDVVVAIRNVVKVSPEVNNINRIEVIRPLQVKQYKAKTERVGNLKARGARTKRLVSRGFTGPFVVKTTFMLNPETRQVKFLDSDSNNQRIR